MQYIFLIGETFKGSPDRRHILLDCLNEFAFRMFVPLENAAKAAGYTQGEGEDIIAFHNRVDDDTFRKAIKEAQAQSNIRTIAERYAYEGDQAQKSKEAKIIAEWIASSPKRIARADELVNILNTSDDPSAYKKAHNELPILIYAKPAKPVFKLNHYRPEVGRFSRPDDLQCNWL